MTTPFEYREYIIEISFDPANSNTQAVAEVRVPNDDKSGYVVKQSFPFTHGKQVQKNKALNSAILWCNDNPKGKETKEGPAQA